MLQVSNWTGFYANGGVGYGLWDAQTTPDVAGTMPHLHQDRPWRPGMARRGRRRIRLSGHRQDRDRRPLQLRLLRHKRNNRRGLAVSGKTNNDSTWFVGARAGWLMTPAVLNYWSVGYTQTHFGGTSLVPDGPGGPAGSIRLESYTAGGWFLGGGLEVAMHDGWFWRSEVRYSDYSNAVPDDSAGAPSAILNFDPVVETATSEIVYKFNWGH